MKHKCTFTLDVPSNNVIINPKPIWTAPDCHLSLKGRQIKLDSVN